MEEPYKNPPIQEAICQFLLADHIPWGIATPGQLFEHFQVDYPGDPAQPQFVQANLLGDASTEGPSLSIVQSPRVLFSGEDATQRLSIGPDLVAIHKMRPYSGFYEELFPRVERDIAKLVSLYRVAFRQVSVRYINRITIPQEAIELTDYLNYVTDPIDRIPFDGGVRAFLYRTELQAHAEPTMCSLTVASLESPAKTLSYLLDIDLKYGAGDPMDDKTALSVLVELKHKEKEIFESLITDKSRAVFNSE